MDNLVSVLFIALPYVSLVIFLLGTILRFVYQGYKVSSLSTQLIESRILYWGSHAFHIGILVLFVGHAIGFLFPKAVLVWEGVPARIMIIEIAAFAFALLCLFGLFTLLVRRVSNVALLNLTSNMDWIIYALLILQIIVGIVVAIFYRWGSLWFASSLAPYLKSIFVLSPDIKAVADMPWPIQLHVVLAFILLALIPFSRLMHILVYPFAYIGRTAIIFIWNINPKTHRGSAKI